MLNTAPPAEKKKAPNLFQRMTGNNWNRKPDREEHSLKDKNKKTAPSTVATELQQAPEPSPPPVAPAQVGPSVEPITQQPRLTGVDTQDRLPTSQGDEDLLDIPAFLRRQAN